MLTRAHMIALALLIAAFPAVAQEPPDASSTDAGGGQIDLSSGSIGILEELWGEQPMVRLVRLYYERDPNLMVGSLSEFRAIFAPRTLVVPVSSRPDAGYLTRQYESVLGEVQARLDAQSLDLPDDMGGDADDYALEDRSASIAEALDAISEDLARELLMMMQTFGAGEERPLLLVFGPRSEVEMLERIVGAVDIPQPEVRLDIWAFQLSGGNARTVGEKSRRVREYIRVTSRLVESYLKQLEICALEELLRNQELYDEAVAAAEESAEEGVEDDGVAGDADEEDRKATFANLSLILPLPGVGIVHADDTGMLALPSARGVHPLSITEMLVVLLMVRADRVGGWHDTLADQIGERLEGWGEELCERDPQAAEQWLELLEAQDQPLRQGADELLREGLGLGRGEMRSIAPMMPRRLLETFRDPVYHRAARGAVENLVRSSGEGEMGSPGLPPRDSRLLAADGRTVLHAAERALSEDLYELFLGPLLSKLHEVAGEGTRTGRGVASNTSITVVSDELGVVQSRSVSYFDVSRPEWEFDVVPREGSRIQSAGAAEGDEFGSEPAQSTASASVGQQLNDLVDGWGVNATHNAQVWEILTDGSVLGFVPHVLPGGSAADIEIELLIARNNPRVFPPGRNPQYTPLDSVAMHRTHTSVYVDSLDLFALSSLSLTTSHPRPDYEVPVLGNLPIIGDMFSFQRGAQSVHHESIMLVYATILPTGADLLELLDFEPVNMKRGE